MSLNHGSCGNTHVLLLPLTSFLTHRRFVSSPLSTSIGWTDTNSGLEKGETWVCADIGASSMDVNIIKIEDGNLRTIAT